jgi:4-diphosphocytidyl-2-C-methyl-D-erythritol kinase
MGGGSSDAAAVIKAMASFHPSYYSRGSMAAMAAEVGSDVPFFLGSACALVGGRGELLQELESRTDYSILVIYPGFSINTAYAFRTLDACRAAIGWQEPSGPCHVWGPELRQSLSDAYLSGDPGSWPFRNDFFGSLAPDYPALVRCRDLLLESGADFASLSGSGSTVFGVFRLCVSRQPAVLALCEAGFNPIRAFPLARLPELD